MINILNEGMLKKYKEFGYVVVKNYLMDEIKKSGLIDDLTHYASVFGENFDISKSFEFTKNLSVQDRQTFYKGLRYLPGLAKFGASNKLQDISKCLGLRFPVLMKSYNIRMDSPSDIKNLFHWHQDITYLLGSKNSLTYWIPLTTVNQLMGSIEVIPRSHLQGLYPFKYVGSESQDNKVMSPKDIRLIEEPKIAGEIIEAEFGDLVVFSQYLLHRSMPNFGANNRWTIQIRHSDFHDYEYKNAMYPMGDNSNIFKENYYK